MVEWSKWIVSSSFSSGSTVMIPIDAQQYAAANSIMIDPTNTVVSSSFDDTAEEVHAHNMNQPQPTIGMNTEYVRRIEEIRALALRFDDPTHKCVSQIQEIYMSYRDTKILTKDEMKFLNRMYNFFTFEAKYHSDKESTIGRINEILGGLNGK